MSHQELKNHIVGSFLKKQYLEAFLVQGAYIESLLKHYADLKFFEATEGNSFDNPVLKSIKTRIEQYTFGSLIYFLLSSGLIAKEQFKSLDHYRNKRNKVIHNLLKELRRDALDGELKETYELGQIIIDTPEFNEMGNLIDEMEVNNVAMSTENEPANLEQAPQVELDQIQNS